MTEDQITELMLAHANGRPLRDILAELFSEIETARSYSDHFQRLSADRDSAK